uniref:Discs large-associated protein 1 n=1 Tax=Rhipicephalus zambeziensis TaxID=60191 RepID=A0A224YX52_9ACAR
MWNSSEQRRFDGAASEGTIEQSFAIPHSLSAGTVLLTGIPEKRRAQPPQSLHLPGPEGDPQVPPMERLCVRVPSTESIGACSLDVDASESSARPMMTKEASEVTLRSMVMSTRENSSVAARGALDSNVTQLSNGCWNIGGSTVDSLTTKVPEHRPSYLGISCAINGYTNYSQFCRSRDSSPARLSPRTSAPHATSPGNHLKVEPILEIKASNGRGELTNGRHHHGPQEMAAVPEPCTSLVQQRIAALYGSEAAERVARSRTRTAKSPLKLEKAVSKRSPSCPAQVVRGRSKSPPVFRHLTRDFKEHLRLSEVSASPAENLPGFIPAASRLPHLGSPEKRAPFSATALRICDVDRGDSSALKEDVLEESRNCQVVNGGGARKLNGNHAAAVDEVDKALDLPVETVPAQHGSSLLSPVCTKALSSSDLPVREGHTFLATLSSTQQVLECHIRDAERDLNEAALSEDMKGRIRAAIGKANLLINKKFKQFKELCLKNIEQNVDDPFPTTGSDLAGFWDMVMLQVDNVHALFEELRVLKANNWVEPAKTESKSMALPRPVKKVASRSMPASPRRSEKAEEAAKSRLEARKRLMEAKRQARQQQQSQPAAAPDEDIAIFVPQEKTN